MTTGGSYLERLTQRIDQVISRELANFVITTHFCTGLYRHWRCGLLDRCEQHFHIVTWPGSLCYTGDMGDYLFQRTEDMVTFMRQATRDPWYAAEKCVAAGSAVREFRKECMEEEFTYLLTNPDTTAEDKAVLSDKLETIRDAYRMYESPADATRAAAESGLWDYGELPDWQTFSYRFLWALRAIRWFCDNVHNAQELKYDQRNPDTVAG